MNKIKIKSLSTTVKDYNNALAESQKKSKEVLNTMIDFYNDLMKTKHLNAADILLASLIFIEHEFDGFKSNSFIAFKELLDETIKTFITATIASKLEQRDKHA